MIIVIVWMIMTAKTGSAWLTPMEVAFVALILGEPSLAHAMITGPDAGPEEK